MCSETRSLVVVLLLYSCCVFVFVDGGFAPFVYRFLRETGVESVRSTCGDEDCGSPLLLTPYIQQGKIKQAQELAQVDRDVVLGVRSYSGFLTVNPSLGSNTFFWYFPAEREEAPAPVLLWLQGGPGASSLFGLFGENGPLEYRQGKLRRRKYHWAATHHLIYFDNPVGTGFSFTRDGYAQNETVVGRDIHNALEQFFLLFPELQENEFFITGESYAGKYVPSACKTIHEKNVDAKIPINLKGFSIGNGFTDPANQFDYSDYVYQLGLVDRNGRDQMQKLQERGKALVDGRQWIAAAEVFDELLNGDMSPYPSLFFNLTGFKSYFNYLHPGGDDPRDDFSALFKCKHFRHSIHVGNATFNVGTRVEQFMRADMMQSQAPAVVELLSAYRGLIYNGQLDIIVAYPLTENYLSNLNFSSAGEYKRAVRHQWRVGESIAGYAKVAGNLTELLVRSAGHMVPADQPRWALDMITRFTNNKPFF